MAQVTIVYWRDIPAQIIVGKGRRGTKRQLNERFEKAIDMAAMRSDARDTDAYLAEWRRGAPFEVEGDDENVANDYVAKLENEYSEEKLKTLIQNGGRGA